MNGGEVLRSQSIFKLAPAVRPLLVRARASIAIFVCAAALAAVGVLSFLTPAGAAAGTTHSKSASAAQAPAVGDQPGDAPPQQEINTTVSVDGVHDGTVPAPPADAMGTPDDSTLVQSDQLYMTKIDSSGATYNQWAKVDPSKTDTGGIGDQGGYGQESARPLLNPNVATAAGRFLDPVTARVLSLKLNALGSDGLLTLSSANGTADPQWGTSPTTTCPADGTCSLGVEVPLLNIHNSLVTVADSGGSPPSLTMHSPGGPSGRPATGQQWTFFDDGSGDGYFQLRNKSDGLCLSAAGLGSAAVAVECADPATAPSTQLWKQVPTTGLDGRAGIAIVSKLDNGWTLSSNDCLDNGCNVRGLSLQYNIGDPAAVFTLTSVNEPGGAIPTWSTLIPNADPATPYAVAAGDLDRVVGSDGNYHDEAVVAYAGPQHHLQVRVIDYNANSNHLLVTAPDQQLPVIGAISSSDGRWFPGNVGVAIGAFDGGAMNDIAVTWQDAQGRFHVTLLAYRETAGGGRALTVIGAPAGITLFPNADSDNSLASGYDQTTAGDFEGIGRDDLAIAYAGIDTFDGQMEPYLGVVSFTRDLKVRGQTTKDLRVIGSLVDREQDGGTWTPHGIRMASGLFKFDPSQGYDFRRRELAAAWSEHNGNAEDDYLDVYDVTPAPTCTDTACDLSIDKQYDVFDIRHYDAGGGEDLPMSMTAGGFAGQGDGSDPPLWGIAMWLPALGSGTGDWIDTFSFDDKGINQDAVPTYPPGPRYILTAYDRAGTSLAVGAPELITLTKLVKGNIIAAQPPAHSDWLPTEKAPHGAFVNVSRNSGFAVTMSMSKTDQYDNTYTTKPGWDLGVTQDFKANLSVGIGDEQNHITGDYSSEEKFAKNWSETDATFSKYSSTVTTNVSTTGTDDDIVQGLFQTYYIYKYPILGPPPKYPDGTPVFPTDCSGQPCQPIYEVTIPGQVVPSDGLGKSLDFYQPSWQNGNALSYPQLVEGKLPLPDLGSYHYYDEHGNKVDVTAPLVDDTIGLGGAKSTHTLTITNQTGGGHETDTANNWELGGEFSAGASGKYDFGGEYGSGSYSLSAGVSGGQTFASSDAGDHGSTEGDSFELDIPTIDANAAYEIGTAYYYDTAGTQKVVHGVDLKASASGREFWERNYGQHVDPALNLPDATFLTYDDLGILDKVLFNAGATRQLIRGFYALQPVNPDSPLTSGVPYATDPKDGDPVTFAVQVHNYSFVKSDPVPIDFYAVPVDSQGLNPTGPPQPIGQVQSLPIPAQGAVTVDSPTWTAKAAGDGQQSWRIFVVVDPDNTAQGVVDGKTVVGEIHPWKSADPADNSCPPDSIDPKAIPDEFIDGKLIDPMTGGPDTLACGQNNQGYGNITVMPNTTTGLGSSATSGTTSTKATHHHRNHHHNQAGNPNAQLGVTAPSGATGPTEPSGSRLQDSTIVTGDSANNLLLSNPDTTPTVHVGDMVTGVIHTTTSADTDAIQPVLIYDGPPSQGHPIAETTVDGATTQDGGYATFTWVAETPGVHTFYETMLGTDPSEDSSQTMKVNVLP